MLGEHMLVYSVSGFIYRDESSKLDKSLMNSVDGFDALNF